MSKFVLLLACLVGMTAAGILNPLRMLPLNLARTNREQIGTDRILSMSRDELLRQKFLLDILMQVQQPLINEELLRLGQELITDPQRYLNGLDDEMLNFIELSRNQNVLGQTDTYSITNEDNLRQMIGLYRMLVNSRDWDTFQRNVCFARVYINGVLLVNSLVLAVRDRDDTRMLIMPAIYEILPELFYDENLIRKAQQLDVNLLDTETRRPGLLDLIGIGRRRQLLQRSGLGMDSLLDRSQLWMPWREFRTELSMRRANGESMNMVVRNEDKLILPVERRIDIGDMSLLVDDIGLNGFLYNLINDLALNEQELITDNRIDRLEREDEVNDQMDRVMGRVGLERNEGSILEKDRLMGRRTDIEGLRVDDMDNVLDRDDRILHVGRRRWMNRINKDMDNDRMIMRENRIVGGRRVVESDSRLMRVRQNLKMQRRKELDLPTTAVNDESLLNINRRRMNERDRFLNVLERNQNVNTDENRRIPLNRNRMVDDDREIKRDRIQLKRRDQLNMMRDDSRLERDMSLGDISDLPTRRIDDERLVHVNRRRLDKEVLDNIDEDILMMQNERRRMIGEGHRVRNRDERNRQTTEQRDIRNDRRTNDEDTDYINRRRDDERRRIIDERVMRDDRSRIDYQRMNAEDRNRVIEDQRRTIDDDLSLRQDDDSLRDTDVNSRRFGEGQQQINKIDNLGLRTTTIDDDRLLHVNRRRLNQKMIDQPENFLEMVERGIGDGRRIIERDNERDRQEDLNLDMRNNIDDERVLQINNLRRKGMTLDDRRQLDENLRNPPLVQMSLLRGMEDVGTERLSMDRNRRNKLDQRGMDVDERTMDLRQRIDDDDVMQRRRIDIVDQDRLLFTGRRRRVDLNDVDTTDRLTNTRQRVRRSLRNDMLNTDRNIIQRLRGGELLLHNLQQLMARIDMERISLRLTGLDVEDIDVQGQRLNSPRLLDDISTGERWALRLNDMRLDTRRNRMLLQRINDIEQRLLTVIDKELQSINIRDDRDIDRIIGAILMGRVQGTTGILQIMRDLMQETVDVQNMNSIVRDPIIQYLLRRIVRIVDRQRQQLSAYRPEDIVLEDVRINAVAVDRLQTYIDVNDADLINLLDQRMMLKRDPLQKKMLVARQQRLNHKSFNINIDLTSNREQRVVVRTLLIPKIDATDRVLRLDESRLNALLLDAAVVDLRVGQNTIKRKSRDINWTTRDTTPLTVIYQRVLLALDEKLDTAMPMDLKLTVGNNCRFPHRLLLPRGRVDGLPMQLLVVVTPVLDVDRNLQQNILDRNLMCGIGVGTLSLDRLPLGFPLDRRIIDVDQLLDLPNLFMKDVTIFHDDKIKLDI